MLFLNPRLYPCRRVLTGPPPRQWAQTELHALWTFTSLKVLFPTIGLVQDLSPHREAGLRFMPRRLAPGFTPYQDGGRKHWLVPLSSIRTYALLTPTKICGDRRSRGPQARRLSRSSRGRRDTPNPSYKRFSSYTPLCPKWPLFWGAKKGSIGPMRPPPRWRTSERRSHARTRRA